MAIKPPTHQIIELLGTTPFGGVTVEIILNKKVRYGAQHLKGIFKYEKNIFNFNNITII